MNFTVIGLGYVGLSNALLLSRKHTVIGYDISESRINSLKKGESYLNDIEIKRFLDEEKLNIEFTTNFEKAVSRADYLIISVPTDYDEKLKNFDVSIIENIIIRAMKVNKNLVYLIKSTVPIGFVECMKTKLETEDIIFIPEFLREGSTLYDCLYPSRIVVGEKSSRGLKLGKVFKECSMKDSVEILLTGSSEAESIKLFSNTYLAMRVGFFNELDTFCAIKGLSSEEIITGMSLDSRIGKGYNNPSFGYGGYCLPKDTRELSSNFLDILHPIVESIYQSNEFRKKFIVEEVLSTHASTIGVYRLTMKSNSDNFKNSALVDILKILQSEGKKILIYEPLADKKMYNQERIISDLEVFKKSSDIILANRIDEKLNDVLKKVYTRDIFKYN